MTQNLPAISSAEIALVRQSLSEGRISAAINHFRNISLTAPLPVLFDIYTGIKHEMISADEETQKRFSAFNDLFLRMLEESGETDNGIYRSLLRDSSEFTYLNSLFSGKIPVSRPEKPQKIKQPATVTPKPEIITLKKIMTAKAESLLLFDISRWYDLVHEHLASTETETLFIKKSAQLINFIVSVESRELFHLELVIVYVFEKLGDYRELTVKSKDFARQAMDLMTDREPLWSKLHKQYLEIIRK